MKKPIVSICIPYYAKMENAAALLHRCLSSIDDQTFKDYEVIITDKGSMAKNTNTAIKQSKGKIIKILFMDDYFTDQNSLQKIVDNFSGGWLVTGCLHNYENQLINPHLPQWTDDIETGNNRIGSPSVMAFANKQPLLFDEKLGWLLDCDLYKRLHLRYGEPTYLYEYNVTIGIHAGQASNIMSNNEGTSSNVSFKNTMIEMPWFTIKSIKRKACVSQTILVRLNVISSMECVRCLPIYLL